ncbi:MAG: TolC family protein [Gammaproteobacteria bacterium]|nr:TolC family protein [Gammaproteobacteria bacterium]
MNFNGKYQSKKFALTCAVFAVIAVLSTSCATKLEEAPTSDEVVAEALPDTEIAAVWSAPAGDTGAVDDDWLTSFNDQQLEQIVDEALRLQNPNMRILAAQVDRAEAAARLAGAALKPNIGLAAGLSENIDASGPEASNSGGGVTMSWEADVWGRVEAGANAAEENLRATVADFEFARQSLVAGVAKSWYLAIELQGQEDLAREVVDIRTDLLGVVETREELGAVSTQDVYLARSDLNAAENVVRQTVAGQREARRALEVLIGRYPGAQIEIAPELVPVPPQISAGLPSELLERRPDLIAADRRVAREFLLTEEARLASLPRFSLSAGAGIGDTISSLSAGLFAPLYTGGAIEAQLDGATASQQAAIAAYGAAALNAFEEVETALTNERLLAEREGFLQGIVSNEFQAYEIERIRYDSGATDILSVLQIQSRWIGGRIALLRLQNERLAQRINLHLALGGSFEVATAN